MSAGDSLWGGLAVNYLGKAFTALLSLLTLPILYRQLGGEAFGLFGLFFSVQVLLGVFDFGVGAALQRDLAAVQAGAASPRAADVVATTRRVERVLWGVAAMACAVAGTGNSFFATHWLNVQALSPGLVSDAVLWMAVAAALQFVGNFYVGCLNALRLHRRTNALQSGVWALRFPLLLWCVGAGVAPAGTMQEAVVPVLQAWAATNALLALVGRALLARALPQPQPGGAPGVASLRRAARFGVPLVAVTTLIMVFNQVDKIAASRLLSLDALGKYTIVLSIAEVMYLMYQPIYTSFLPVFCARHAAVGAGEDPTLLWESIGLAGQIMAIAVLPVAAVLFTFPALVIFAWTGDAPLATSGASVLRWVIVGAMVNAFLFIPFALQQAAGDLRPWGWRIAVTLAVYMPLALAAIQQWGMQGAAAAWCTGSALLALWLARTTAQQLGPGPGRGGLLAATAPAALRTLLACGLVAALAAAVPAPAGRIGAALLALAILCLCGLAALRSQTDVWSLCLRALSRLRSAPQEASAP